MALYQSDSSSEDHSSFVDARSFRDRSPTAMVQCPPVRPEKTVLSKHKIEYLARELETAENALLDACMSYEAQIAELKSNMQLQEETSHFEIEIEMARSRENDLAYKRINGSLREQLFGTTKELQRRMDARAKTYEAIDDGTQPDAYRYKAEITGLRELNEHLRTTLGVVRTQLEEQSFQTMALRMERDKLLVEKRHFLKEVDMRNQIKTEKEYAPPPAPDVNVAPRGRRGTVVFDMNIKDEEIKTQQPLPKPDIPDDTVHPVPPCDNISLGSEVPVPTSVYIRGIPEEMGEDALLMLFAHAHVNKVIKRRGTASVTFASEVEANYIVEQSNSTDGIILGGNRLKIKHRKSAAAGNQVAPPPQATASGEGGTSFVEKVATVSKQTNISKAAGGKKKKKNRKRKEEGKKKGPVLDDSPSKPADSDLVLL